MFPYLHLPRNTLYVFPLSMLVAWISFLQYLCIRAEKKHHLTLVGSRKNSQGPYAQRMHTRKAKSLSFSPNLSGADRSKRSQSCKADISQARTRRWSWALHDRTLINGLFKRVCACACVLFSRSWQVKPSAQLWTTTNRVCVREETSCLETSKDALRSLV